MNIDPLDKFGHFITQNLRDNSIEFAQDILAKKYKSDQLKKLQSQLATLNEETRAIVLAFTQTVAQEGIHNFSFALQKQSELENEISISVHRNDGVMVYPVKYFDIY